MRDGPPDPLRRHIQLPAELHAEHFRKAGFDLWNFDVLLKRQVGMYVKNKHIPIEVKLCTYMYVYIHIYKYIHVEHKHK